MALFTKILDAFYPPMCPACQSETLDDGYVCHDCFSSFEFLNGCLCRLCGYPLEKDKNLSDDDTLYDFDEKDYDETFGTDTYDDLCLSCIRKPPPFILRSSLVYNDISKDLILKLKYADRMDIGKTLAHFMLPFFQDYPDVDTLVPIPLHWTRLWKRRYNQATVLCQYIQQGFQKKHPGKIPPSLITHNLVRIKSTQSQGHQRYLQRVENMRGAFHVRNPQLFDGRTIALVDDVYTTGATLRACAKALQKAGVKKIYALTISRVIRGENIG